MSFNRGWYPDLQRKNRRRYWDGQQWGRSALTPGAIVRRALAIAGGSFGGLIVLLVVIGLLSPTAPSSPSVVAAPATTHDSASSEPTDSATGSSTARATPSGKTPHASPTSDGASRSTSASPAASTSAATTRAGPAKKSSPSAPNAPTTTATAPASKIGSALAAAEGLTVKGRAPKTGYSRDLFGAAWSDIDANGCRQRDDVLNRDLTDKRFDGCTVLSGTLRDPYTGATIHFHRGLRTSTEVQIDHVVALSDAWQKGAQQWSSDERRRFANDTLNLLAVGQSVNESKGDGDAATWLPPKKSYRCAYVARQVAVKKTYRLWVTAAERAAMIRILSTCPDRRLPTRAAIPTHPTAKPSATTPTAKVPRPPRATHSAQSQRRSGSSTKSGSAIVHPGAFCSPLGSTGRTTKGTAMVCSTKPGDPRARWRSAG